MTPLTNQEIESLILQYYNKMQRIFPDFLTPEAFKAIHFVNTDKDDIAFGSMCLSINPDMGTFLYSLELNPNLFYKEITYVLINTICHELCHYVQHLQLVNTGIYKIENGEVVVTNEARRRYVMGEDGMGGHSAYWQGLADKVTSILKLEVPIKATVPSDIFQKAFLRPNLNQFLCAVMCENEHCLSTMVVKEIPSLNWQDVNKIVNACVNNSAETEKLLDHIRDAKLFKICASMPSNVPIFSKICIVCDQPTLTYYVNPAIDLRDYNNRADIFLALDATLSNYFK